VNKGHSHCSWAIRKLGLVTVIGLFISVSVGCDTQKLESNFGIKPGPSAPGTMSDDPRIPAPTPSHVTASEIKFPFSEAEYREIIGKIKSQIKTMFEARLSESQIPELEKLCAGTEADTYARHLFVKGAFEILKEVVSKCDKKMSNLAANYAALALRETGDRNLAMEMFRVATTNRTLDPTAYDGALMNWAGVDYEKEIIFNHSTWSEEKKSLMYNILLVISRLAVEPGVNRGDVIKALHAEIKSASGYYKEVLLRGEIMRAVWAGSDDSAYPMILDELSNLKDPTLFWYPIYRLAFGTPETVFKLAREIYDTAHPFLHERSSFPNEDNTLTYTEITTDICKQTTLQGQSAKDFSNLKQLWKAKLLTIDEFYNKIKTLDERNPNRVETLVAMATYWHAQGEIEKARKIAFQANRLCAYYHRANWIMTSVRSTILYRSFPEYADLEAKKNEVVAGLKLSDKMGSYILNWDSLTQIMKDNIAWSMQLWLPYVDVLADLKFNAYIKFPFELSSEAPGLEDIKDQRAGYPRDNRLWDDMRGAGGPQMMSDYFQTPEAPYGNYNLFQHEMAHQVDSYMEVKMPKAQSCLNLLFDQATQRNLFVADYARNRPEYFAVNAESYAIPENYPKRFGVQRTWQIQNDANLGNYIELVSRGPEVETNFVCPQAIVN